jgi:hypothetical protein
VARVSANITYSASEYVTYLSWHATEMAARKGIAIYFNICFI